MTVDKYPLHAAAARSGGSDEIRALIAGGLDVDSRDDRGRTPLHIVSAFGLVANARVLIDAGADVNAQDDDGNTPLHYATGVAQVQNA